MRVLVERDRAADAKALEHTRPPSCTHQHTRNTPWHTPVRVLVRRHLDADAKALEAQVKVLAVGALDADLV